MVFCGISWCSVMFHGILCYSVMFCVVLCYSVMSHGVSWYFLVICGVSCYHVIFHVFCGILSYSVLFHCILWCSRVFCDVLWPEQKCQCRQLNHLGHITVEGIWDIGATEGEWKHQNNLNNGVQTTTHPGSHHQGQSHLSSHKGYIVQVFGDCKNLS